MTEIDTASYRAKYHPATEIGIAVRPLLDEIDRLRANEKQVRIACNEKLRLSNEMLNDLRDAIVAARTSALEDAAKLVRGEVYKTIYRTWPALKTWIGDLHRENQAVKICDALADAINALASVGGEKGAANG